AGADCVVVGSGIFASADPESQTRRLKSLMERFSSV
ncbi:MAG: ribulose-phosphate 3-epimerase, partial [Aquificae bacterium]|nr:ribulose-phosphate 3-epimerase [Aquificota bacterium]